MTRRLSICLTALAIGALIAGCGSSSRSTSSQTVSSPVATGISGPAAATGATGLPHAVALCRQLLRLATAVAPGEKSKVEETCDKAAKSNLATARKAVKEACARVIGSAPVSGAARQIAIASCQAQMNQ